MDDEIINVASTGGSVVGMIVVLVYLAMIIFCIAGAWKMFVKAGEPGWAILIPIYNAYVMCKIAGKPGWWVLLLFIPLVGIIISFIVTISLVEKFGKGIGFGILAILFPFVCFPILGFGDAEYEG